MIALEPGAYGENWGVRVEQVVVVTADGCDVLSGHDLSDGAVAPGTVARPPAPPAPRKPPGDPG